MKPGTRIIVTIAGQTYPGVVASEADVYDERGKLPFPPNPRVNGEDAIWVKLDGTWGGGCQHTWIVTNYIVDLDRASLDLFNQRVLAYCDRELGRTT